MLAKNDLSYPVIRRLSSEVVRRVGLLFVWVILFPFAGSMGQAEEQYLGPWQVRATADGSRVLVLCKDAAKIAIIDPNTQQIVGWIATPAQPSDFVISPDGQTLFVSAGVAHGIVVVLDNSGKRLKEFRVGHSPCGLSLSPDGRFLFVCNRFKN
ncbi:MAG TPA: YncE family protein, partial [Thermogutta sp.]|nr:YncE family protein [Thermogutta sp.]